MKRPGFRTAASLLLLALAASDASAQSSGKKKDDHPQDQPALVTADQMVFDRDLNLVTARGHVEVDQGSQVLRADALSYNLKQDVIIATGHVSFTETSGDINFADYMEVTGDMKQATARGIRVLMFDDSRLAGNFAKRTDGTLTVLDRAVYTACKPCLEDPSKPPVWDIKADRVIHDEESHLIEYENAWLEIDGIPVAYTPYLSHADPTIKRVSGWLPPSVLNNNILGTGVRTPYFDVIDDHQDVTIAPMLTTNDDAMLGLTYRYKNAYGEIKATGSITELQPPNYTGHGTVGWNIDTNALFDLDENWRAGAQLQRASDVNYLPTIDLTYPQPYLTVRPYIENFTYSNYFAVEAYSFQTLSSTPLPAGATVEKDPVVFPMITYSFVGDTDALGGYTTFDTHSAVISRLNGTNDRQVNTQTSWHLPVTTDDGQLFRFTGTVRADAYNSSDLAAGLTTASGAPVTGAYNGTNNATRFVPALSVDWRYPFTSIGEHSSQTITPIVMVAASPNTGNSIKIPNNDSLDFELNDVNIFSPTPSSGYDRMVSGPRVAYGFQYDIVNRGGEAADFVLGQSYQMSKQTELPVGTGLDNYMSDIVGRADVTPSQNLVLQYRFRLDHDNLELRRSEVSASIGPRPLNLNIGYTFYDKLSPTSPFDAREQVSSTLSAQVSHYWSTQVYTIQNLGEQAGPLQSGVRLTYDDDCFTVTADAGSRHTTSPVFNVGHYFTLRFNFKTLGQLPVDLF
jgi:LPS-assembly protein